MIENIEVIDLGIFSGKTLGFTLKIPSRNIKVIRTESCFRWLYGVLELEFPFIPLPPLV